jgi:hypothetical protein
MPEIINQTSAFSNLKGGAMCGLSEPGNGQHHTQAAHADRRVRAIGHSDGAIEASTHSGAAQV